MKNILKFLPDFLVKRCPKSGRIIKIKFDNIYAKLLFPLVGILAIIWFLVRVIPKPSRVSYPCQQVAMGIGGSFLIYLAGIFTSLTIYQQIRKRINKSFAFVYLVGIVLIIPIIIVVARSYNSESPENSFEMTATHPEGPNEPMGVGKGIFPGRVVWVRDTMATDWDGKEKSWWDDEHTDQKLVSGMFSNMLRKYTEEKSDKASWDAIFKYYNKTHSRGDFSYKPGEKIVIKINCNHDRTSYEWDNEVHPSPAVIYALVSQLIEVVGVKGDDITVAEPSQLIGNPVYDKIRSNPGKEYQNVWFAERDDDDAPQRIRAEPDPSSSIYFTMLDTTTKTFSKKIEYYLPKCYTEATYLINLAILRGHRVFGVTLNSKNHFGSIYWPEREKYLPGDFSNLYKKGLPSEIRLHSFSLWDYHINNKLGQPSFSPFIIGHKSLGGKELLYLVDGIYTSKLNERGMVKFTTLDNDWCSSLFVSQDPVAIQSVGADILCNEPNVTDGNPSFVVHLDNFLIESALAGNPPSGFKYDPENDGTFIKESLGVHEHWNNSQEKKYSRNMGKKEGIELITQGVN
jgi:hypothetical protein